MSIKTIFACSSGSGRAGIAVWRISGPKALMAAECLAGKGMKARKATYRKFRDQTGDMIDDGIVLLFPGPQSVTGEDLAELHTHGSEAVRIRMIEVFSHLGLSPASPGEFTLRAFENGKMDLLAVEALGDLLDAETQGQRRQAIAAAQGEGGAILQRWRDQLISALAVLEASVDFPDEEDVPDLIADKALPHLQRVAQDMNDQLGDGGAKRLREGVSLAIVGAPNAGKSSFINKLTGEDRALVSDIAGTTRDIVSARVSLGERLVNVLDTAGLREETNDPIEKAGMLRAKKAAQEADIILYLQDATAPLSPMTLDVTGEVITTVNKTDLGIKRGFEGLPLSLKTGEGWQVVLEAITAKVQHLTVPALFSHERQISLITNAINILDHTLAAARNAFVPELLADDVRMCLDALDQLDGRRTTEAVLGEIFSSFCIGK